MHELSVSRAIAEAALRHAQGRRVRALHVRVGALRQVVAGSLAFYFEIVTRGGPCAGARLELEAVAPLLRCEQCGREWDPAPPPQGHGQPLAGGLPALPSFRCPGCAGSRSEVVRGAELEVEWIEVDEWLAVGR